MSSMLEEKMFSIESIFWPDGEGSVSVGDSGITSIVPIKEQDGSIWLVVTREGHVKSRYNSRFLEGINYKDENQR